MNSLRPQLLINWNRTLGNSILSKMKKLISRIHYTLNETLDMLSVFKNTDKFLFKHQQLIEIIYDSQWTLKFIDMNFRYPVTARRIDEEIELLYEIISLPPEIVGMIVSFYL